MRKKKVLISTSSFGDYDQTPVNLLNKLGCSIVLNPFKRKLTKDETLTLLKDCEGVIAGTEPLDANTLENLPSLKVISRCGTGLDNVDLIAAERIGIEVFNTPDVPTVAVAELTVGLILNLLRKVNIMDKAIRNGKWEKLMGNLLSGKKLGIIGFGRIGQKVGELLRVFGTELAYCDVEPKMCSFGCSDKGFEEILGWADIITLHLSPPKGCSHVIGEKELLLMKKGSWLVNVSRGGVVDEDALYGALKDGHLAGAALDVFKQEPYNGRLKELENVILTSHIGSYTVEARIEMEKQAVDNLIKGFKKVGLL